MKELNIRKERLTRGKEWTQEYVGQQVGVSKVAIHDIETGNRKPSYDVLLKLENLFNKSHRYLLAQVEDSQQSDFSTPPPDTKAVSANLAEGKRAVAVLSKAAKIISCSEKVAELMQDYGENGQVDCEEFRPVFEELREVVNGAFG